MNSILTMLLAQLVLAGDFELQAPKAVLQDASRAVLSMDAIQGSARMAVPAHDLLQTARKLKPQTSPRYSVEGTLSCSYNSDNYTAMARCDVGVDGKSAMHPAPMSILRLVMGAVPPRGPFYSFKASFKAWSSQNEEGAEMSITELSDGGPMFARASYPEGQKVVLPEQAARSILASARKIQPQTQPNQYVIRGRLRCDSAPEYSGCILMLHGQIIGVAQAESIISMLKPLFPSGGPFKVMGMIDASETSGIIWWESQVSAVFTLDPVEQGPEIR